MARSLWTLKTPTKCLQEFWIFSLFARVQMPPVKEVSVHPGEGHCAQSKNVSVFNIHNKLLTFFGIRHWLSFCLTATINLDNFNTVLQQRRLRWPRAALTLTHIITASLLHNAWKYLLHICRMAPTGASFCLVELSTFLPRTTMELWITITECNYWTHKNCETPLCAAGMTAAVFFVLAVYFSSINHLRCYFWGFGSEADHVEWHQPRTSAFSSYIPSLGMKSTAHMNTAILLLLITERPVCGSWLC